MNETELVTASLTLEELDEANRYARMLADSWVAQTRDGGTDGARLSGFRTDGPFHAIAALRLALLAEMTARGGAEPWYAGAPLDGHPAAEMLRLYQRRYGFRELEPAANAAGVLERTCIACGQAKPQTETNFERVDGLWLDRCRECDRADVGLIPLEALVAPAPPVEPVAAGMELL